MNCFVSGIVLHASFSVFFRSVARHALGPDTVPFGTVHSAILQAAVIKAVSLCLRARSWAVPPPVDELAVPEDAVVCLADAGARDRDGY